MIKVEKLDSGITLVKHKLVESHAIGMAIFVKAGVVTEDENEKGISHLMEHMHFKGTKNYIQQKSRLAITQRCLMIMDLRRQRYYWIC